MNSQPANHSSWKHKVSSFFFGVLVLLLIGAAIALAIWFESGREQSQQDCINAEMTEAYEDFGNMVYADDHFREEAEEACQFGP